MQIILAHFTASEKKNLVSILFFISLLTLLSGIILKKGAPAESVHRADITKTNYFRRLSNESQAYNYFAGSRNNR